MKEVQYVNRSSRILCTVVSFLFWFVAAAPVLVSFLVFFPPSAQAREVALSPGWDIFSEPLAIGKVDWNVLSNGTLKVTFELRGASPNHKYIVGTHFFDPGNAGKLRNVCEFGGGWKVGCERSALSREGVTATVIGGWDFGYVTTNVSGYGRAQFIMNPPPGTYYIQFTVRIGDQCNPATGQTGGCAAVYRTGNKMGQGFEVITIPGRAALSPGWDIFSVPLTMGYVDWNVLDDGTLQVAYELNGASPNHKYIVGTHFFDPGNVGNLPNVCKFDGWKVGCDRSTLSREGVNATVIGGWDFGYVNTNGSGYGKAQFALTPPSGTYYIQFTVRIGDKCDPASGQTSGCAAVYRTGSKMGRGFEVINIP